MSDIQFGYEPPRMLAVGLWEVRGAWKNKLGRRMTVVVLRDGGVVVHNPIRLHEDELEWLSGLGQVRHIVAPNIFHCSDLLWMARHYPEAQLYAPLAKLTSLQEQGYNILDVNREFPLELASELECVPMHGTRMHEAAFVHKPSRTLILCDLAFNMESDSFLGIEKFIMDWNKVGVRFGPSRLTRWLFTSSKRELRESYRRLLAADFDRVIVNHGAILDSGGKLQLQAGVEEIFGKL
ncbi:MAG: DUF4336 domain-containing protein [Bdellovibrionales bacterium]|nr:DUF4336 domain-containing protein [Bdellovibrionales bacterium]